MIRFVDVRNYVGERDKNALKHIHNINEYNDKLDN